MADTQMTDLMRPYVLSYDKSSIQGLMANIPSASLGLWAQHGRHLINTGMWQSPSSDSKISTHVDF